MESVKLISFFVVPKNEKVPTDLFQMCIFYYCVKSYLHASVQITPTEYHLDQHADK